MEAKGSPMSTKKVKTERGESRYGPAKKVRLGHNIPEHTLIQAHTHAITVSTDQKASHRSSE